VLQNGKIVQKGNPEEAFKNPYNSYVAKLFGEVNIFNENEMQDFQISKFSYYPKEIKISESGFEAEVLESRFAGNYYWNKVRAKDKEIILYSDEKLNGTIAVSFG